MTVSGNISVEVFDARRVIDKAFRRAKVPPQIVGSEYIDVAFDALYLLCSELSNKGVTLWTVEKVLIATQLNQANIPLPAGTLKVLNANYRTVTRFTGTMISAAGGTAANLDDGDLDTACTQLTANGDVSATFDSSQAVTTIGVCSNGDQWYELTAQRSDDGVTWTDVLAIDQQLYLDRQFYWFDIDAALPASYFRIVEGGGNILDLRELVFGWNPYAVTMGRLNRDQYTAYSNKTFPGQAYQFWFDRKLNGGNMVVWPVVNDIFAHLEVWRQRQIMDPGTMVQQIEMPQQWLNAITWMLAETLADEIPEAPPDRAAYCKMKAQECEPVAWGRESDGGPVNLLPAIGVYTE